MTITAEEAPLKKYTVLAVTMSAFLTPFMGSAVNLAVPSIGAQFQSPALYLSWVVTSYILSSVAFLVPFGRLADIRGRKLIFLLGMLIFSLTSIMCGLSWSIQSLILFRIMQGIGSAMIFGTGLAMLTSVFPPQERGRVLGINVAVVYVGLSIGPVLGGILNHNLGWPSIFYLSAIIGLFTVAITISKLKGEWAGAEGEPYDFKGAFLYIIGISGLVYGISSLSAAAAAKFIVLISMVVIAFFIYTQIKASFPVLDLSLFTSNRAFVLGNLAALINFSATFAVGFLLSLYLQIVAGYNSQTAGFILLAQPVVMAVLSPFAGHFSDRVDARLLSSWGMIFTTLGLIVFIFLNQFTSLWLIVFNLALLGLGFSLFSSPNTNAIMGSVEKRYYGIASSSLGTMRLIGQAASIAIATLVLTSFVGNVQLSPAHASELLQASRASFIVFSILCFLGVFASWPRKDSDSGQEKALT